MTDVEQKDIEVAREDQERINKFSRLNMRFDELDEEITTMKSEIQAFKDAVEEVEGCMEADGILMKIGEAYTSVDEDSVTDAEVKVGQHFGCPFPPRFRRQRCRGFGVNHGAQKPEPSLQLYLRDCSECQLAHHFPAGAGLMPCRP